MPLIMFIVLLLIIVKFVVFPHVLCIRDMDESDKELLLNLRLGQLDFTNIEHGELESSEYVAFNWNGDSYTIYHSPFSYSMSANGIHLINNPRLKSLFDTTKMATRSPKTLEMAKILRKTYETTY